MVKGPLECLHLWQTKVAAAEQFSSVRPHTLLLSVKTVPRTSMFETRPFSHALHTSLSHSVSLLFQASDFHQRVSGLKRKHEGMAEMLS